MTREAVALLHLYVEKKPNQSDEEAMERLHWLLHLIEQEGVSIQVHEEYMQDI